MSTVTDGLPEPTTDRVEVTVWWPTNLRPYRYLALRVDDQWYSTAVKHDLPLSWDDFTEWFERARLVEVRALATGELLSSVEPGGVVADWYEDAAEEATWD